MVAVARRSRATRERRNDRPPRVDREKGTRGAGPPCGKPPSGLERACLIGSWRLPGGAGQRGEDEMIDRLESIARRYREIEQEMARPDVASDHEKVTLLAREQRTMRDIVTAYDAYRRARQEMESAREMLRHEKDPDMQEYLRSEQRRPAERLGELEEQLRVLLLAKGPSEWQ